MPSNSSVRSSARRAVTLVELMIVLTMLGVVAGLGLPRLNLGDYRADAAAQQVRSVLQTAQRTSLTRQYDVIVSVDTVQSGLRIAEDVNNNGSIEISEWKFWRPLGEGNRFRVPPTGLTTTAPTTSVVGSQLTTVGQLPSVVFHRDGSASTDAELYVSSSSRQRTDFRAVGLTRSTGRSELYKLAGAGPGATWRIIAR